MRASAAGPGGYSWAFDDAWYGPPRHGRAGLVWNGAPDPVSREEADQGSVLAFVFEGELKLGAVGDRSAFIQVNVLLNDLSHSKIADGPGRSPDRPPLPRLPMKCRLSR